MFLFIGLSLFSLLILIWFYFFILKRYDVLGSWIWLIIISCSIGAFLFMHMIITAIIVFILGSFMIKFHFRDRSKK
jgi:hypothetical protein